MSEAESVGRPHHGNQESVKKGGKICIFNPKRHLLYLVTISALKVLSISQTTTD